MNRVTLVRFRRLVTSVAKQKCLKNEVIFLCSSKSSRKRTAFVPVWKPLICVAKYTNFNPLHSVEKNNFFNLFIQNEVSLNQRASQDHIS